jgi:protein-disulfide isomerase
VLPNLLSRYVRTNKVRIEARPIAFIGPDSKRGRAAAIAAGQQNKLFNYMEILYANQKTENTGWLNDSMFEKAAASIPRLNVPLLLTARSSAATNSAQKRFDSLASTDNVRGTPTILVGKTGGALHQVAPAQG